MFPLEFPLLMQQAAAHEKCHSFMNRYSDASSHHFYLQPSPEEPWNFMYQ